MLPDDASARLLQPLWDALVRALGVDTISHPLFFVLAIISTVLAAGLGFSAVDVFVTRKLPFKAAAKYLLITLPGYLAVFMLLVGLPAPYHVEVPRTAPRVLELVGGVAVLLVLGDLLSYWWHRLEHGSTLVWRHVHSTHHAVRCPLTVWSGFYVHPIESLCVFVTFYIVPFALGVHPLIFAAYAMINTFITMVTHCGYDLPLYPNSIFASAPMHEHHHGGGKPRNFSVLLTLSDRLFGTFKPS